MAKSDYEKHDHKMKRTMEVLAQEYATIRAGQANPAVLDRMSVEYYGVQTPLSQVASISAPEARTLLIQPWDPTMLKAIEKTILTSDLGIHPQNDGRIIRLNFPPLTEERRRDLAKQVRKLSEEAKVAVRNVRREAVEQFKAQKKKSVITEDDLAIAEKDIQEMTDQYIKDIDALTAKKEKELTAV